MTFRQPTRKATDGAVRVSRAGIDELEIVVETKGNTDVIMCSEYNAARVFGMLALFLGVTLPKSVGKAIKLGEVKAGIE